MYRVIAYSDGLPVAEYPHSLDLQAAAAAWCIANGATQLCVSSMAYGHAAVTVALPDQTRRSIEFVVAVG